MPIHSKRQALAVAARISSLPQQTLPGNSAGEVADLEKEAARIVADDAALRAAGNLVHGHVVIDGGRLSGLIRDAHTTVRFAGGSIAVTTHE